MEYWINKGAVQVRRELKYQIFKLSERRERAGIIGGVKRGAQPLGSFFLTPYVHIHFNTRPVLL